MDLFDLANQSAQERLNLGLTHVARMPQDGKPRPVQVSFTRTQAVVEIAYPLMQLVQQANSLKSRRGDFGRILLVTVIYVARYSVAVAHQIFPQFCGIYQS